MRFYFEEGVKCRMYSKSSHSVRSFIGGFPRHDREFSLVLLIVQELETIGGYLETKEGQLNEQSDYILQLADRCIRGNQPRHFTIPCFLFFKSFSCNTYGTARKCCKQKAYVQS